MRGAWTGLLSNMSIVAGVLLVWTQLRDATKTLNPTAGHLVLGLAMGVGTLIVMAFPVHLAPGIKLDLRLSLLAVAGFFGGPLEAVSAAVLPLAYRLYLGGVGAPGGSAVIVAGAAIAVAIRRMTGTPTVASVAGLTGGVGAVSISSMAVLCLAGDATVKAALVDSLLPSLCINLAAVSLAGLFMLREEGRRELIGVNALFRAVMDGLPDCLNVKDLEGRFLAANPATATLMGAASAAALIGKTDFDFYPDATARLFRADEASVMAAGQPVRVRQQAVFGDGRSAVLSTLKVPFRDPAGHIVGLVTHNRDVTATHQVEEDLKRTRQQLADALAYMVDGLVMYDRDGRIILCNEQYGALFPLTADLRVPGALHRNILRQAVARGEEVLQPGADVEAWIEAGRQRLAVQGRRMIGLADGRWIEVRTRPLADGVTLAVFCDVTARELLQTELEHKAAHDPLTGLANRAAFDKALAQAHLTARAKNADLAVMLIDLDHFKQVNDSFGHAAGDRLLIEVARRLEADSRAEDVVARLGGDEFAILTVGEGLGTGCERLARRILEGLTRPLDVDGIRLFPSASIGLSLFSNRRSDPKQLVAEADQALYDAKSAGRRTWAAYDPARPRPRLAS